MNIAIVGAGIGGRNVIKSLNAMDDISIKIVVDKNFDAPGMLLAREMNLKCSDNIDDIGKFSIDMIIEATGNDKVTKTLFDKYGNVCKIIDSHGAYLIMSLVEKNIETLERVNNQIEIINETSSVVNSQLQEIFSSIEYLHSVSDSLLASTQDSNKYIEESDKVITYVNKIASQIKILGLNATIEAARAGEYGKGFAVVAKEIQGLANNSETFAKEINEMLKKLSKEMKNMNIEIDKLKSLSQNQIDSSELVSVAMSKLLSETNK